MKKLILTISTLFFMAGTYAYAGSCEIPKFIKKGDMVNIQVDMSSNLAKNAKVLDIDKKACWIKIDHNWFQESPWLNLNTILAVGHAK